MPPASSRVFTDDAVSSVLLDLIREAKKHVVLVSPYNSFWVHLKNELHWAAQRGVQIIALYRSDGETRDVEWLVKEGATAYAVPNLHAKMYFNESTVLLASMNLTGGRNSMEVGVLVDESAAKELRDYVKRLMDIGTKFEPAAPPPPARETREPRAPYSTKPEPQQPPQRDPVTRTRDNVVGKIEGVLTTIRTKMTGGKCIRCGDPIPYDAGKPLCAEHFTEWDRFKNANYPEHYCHKCGKEWRTSFAKPLCTACFTANPASRPPFGRQGFVPTAAASRPDDPAQSPQP